MAFLVPLLLPSVLDATTNLAVGISNTLQSTSSSFSIQLGSRVFTTNKGFPLPHLPYELRIKIILMALEESRSLILPPPIVLNPHQPLTHAQFAALQARSPLNPASPHYRSIVGERRSANGFPVSSWRWLGVSREWWAVLRSEMWRDCVVGGWRQWANLMVLLESPDFHALPFVKTLILHEGSSHPSDIYALLTSPHLKNLTSLSILPLYPHPSSPFNEPPRPFPLGLQLIPVRSANPLQTLNIGIPLELCTTEAARQHLSRLRPRELGVSLRTLTEEMLGELEMLVGGPRVGIEDEDDPSRRDPHSDSTDDARPRGTELLSIRYLPTRDRPFIDPSLFIHPSLSAFPHLTVYLPKMASYPQLPYPGQPVGVGPDRVSFAQKVVDLIASDPVFGVEGRVTVWVERGEGALGEGLGVGMGGDGAERVWPVEMEVEGVEEVGEEMGGMTVGEKGKGETREEDKEKGWERQTDLRLFGGLIGVRMESRKT